MKKLILNHSNTPILFEKYVKHTPCPTCKEGMFIGRRDLKTFKLLAEDNCLGCGQPAIYKTLPEGY